ncbi:hypothetical protein SKA34_01487 [Photobacterium sp. SKA34]|nr:hypothetical protein SKA34_01487 [Photobacterium sp. SKA34]
MVKKLRIVGLLFAENKAQNIKKGLPNGKPLSS